MTEQDVERRIAEAIVRRCEAWGDPDCEGHAKWFAPEVRRLIEAAFNMGRISTRLEWDALLLVSDTEEPK